MTIATRHYFIHGNSITVLPKLQSNSLQLCITSPPYYNAREYSQWQTFDAYMQDMCTIFTEVFRVLANHRVCVVNVADVVGKTGDRAYTHHRIALGAHFIMMMERIGFEFVDDFIWDKGEPQSNRHMHGFSTPYPFYINPINCYEHILVFHKHVLDDTKIPCPICGETICQNNGFSEDGVRSWECKNPACPEKSEAGRGKRYSERSIMMDKGQQPCNKVASSLITKWHKDIIAIPPVIKINADGDNTAGHSAPFPIAIPDWAIRYYSYQNEWVLDPFAGSFTTTKAAILAQRNSIGIELNDGYIELGKKRYDFAQRDLFGNTPKCIELKNDDIVTPFRL